MALAKRNYVSGKTVITAENLNEIQDAIIALEGTAGDDGTHPAYYIDLAGNYPNYTARWLWPTSRQHMRLERYWNAGAR